MIVDANTVLEFIKQGNPDCPKCRRLQRQISWLKRTYDAEAQSDMLRCFADSCEFQHEVSNKFGHCHNVYEVLTSCDLPDELKDAAQTIDLLAKERDEVNKALHAIFDGGYDLQNFAKLPDKPDSDYETAIMGGEEMEECLGCGSGDEPEEAIINAVRRARELGHLPPEEEKKDEGKAAE